MRRTAVASLLMLALAVVAAAQDGASPRLSVAVEPRTGEVGLVMNVVVKVQGAQAADCHLLEVPEMVGARLDLVEGPRHSQSTYIVNGRVTHNVEAEWRLRLVPSQDGELRLPPFRLNCRGTTHATEPLVVPVRGNTVPEDVVTLDVRWPTEEIWQGQVFEVLVEAAISEEYADRIVSGGLQLTLAWYEGLGGLVRLDDPPSAGRVGHLYLNGSRNPVATDLARRSLGERRDLVSPLPVRMLASRWPPAWSRPRPARRASPSMCAARPPPGARPGTPTRWGSSSCPARRRPGACAWARPAPCR